MIDAPVAGFKTHLFSYNLDGATWLFEIKAENADDAVRRLGRLQFAQYKGELIAKVPAEAGSRALSSLLGFLKWLLPFGRR